MYSPEEITTLIVLAVIAGTAILLVVDTVARWLAKRIDSFNAAWSRMMDRVYTKLYNTLLSDIARRREIESAMLKTSEGNHDD
jgi:DNA-binding IscR family transcriptional regulator